jgi:hypothetical protein
VPARRHLIAGLVLGSLLSARAVGGEPHTGRIWLYVPVTAAFSPSWSLTLMPGLRVEVARSEGDIKSYFLTEVFVGPNVAYRRGGLTLKLSLWYYYTGFRLKDDHASAQNIELIPHLDYAHGRWTFTFRTIFHNTIHSTVYPDADDRWGYGLVMRNLFQVKLNVLEKLGVIVADEPFWGLVQGSSPQSSAGYWARGVRLNRVYAGVEWKINRMFALTPMYVYESVFDDKDALSESEHYLFVTFSSAFKLF